MVLGLNKSVDLQIKVDPAKGICYIILSLVMIADVLGHLWGPSWVPGSKQKGQSWGWSPCTAVWLRMHMEGSSPLSRLFPKPGGDPKERCQEI